MTYNLPANYNNISQPERREVRQQYRKEQDNLCYYCECSLDVRPIHDKEVNWDLFPSGKGFLKYPVHLHHCHDTGMTIGAVHAYCNAVLWQYHGE